MKNIVKFTTAGDLFRMMGVCDYSKTTKVFFIEGLGDTDFIAYATENKVLINLDTFENAELSEGAIMEIKDYFNVAMEDSSLIYGNPMIR